MILKKSHWLPRFLCSRFVRIPFVVVESCRVQQDTTTWVKVFFNYPF